MMTLKYVFQKLPHMPLRIRQRLRRDGIFNTLSWVRHSVSWRLREKRLGIDTREHAFGIDIWGPPDGGWYDPLDYRCCDIVFDYLKPNPQQDVFLDYGAGLGRPCIVAAMQPFRRVLGVEINSELVCLNRRQVEQARARGKLGCEVEIIQADGAEFKVPPDVNRILMHNTFMGDLLQRVLEQIRRSLAADPRPLLLVYAPMVIHGNEVEGCPWLELECELPTGFWNHVKMYVYRANLDRVREALAAIAQG